MRAKALALLILLATSVQAEAYCFFCWHRQTQRAYRQLKPLTPEQKKKLDEAPVEFDCEPILEAIRRLPTKDLEKAIRSLTKSQRANVGKCLELHPDERR